MQGGARFLSARRKEKTGLVDRAYSVIGDAGYIPTARLALEEEWSAMCSGRAVGPESVGAGMVVLRNQSVVEGIAKRREVLANARRSYQKARGHSIS